MYQSQDINGHAVYIYSFSLERRKGGGFRSQNQNFKFSKVGTKSTITKINFDTNQICNVDSQLDSIKGVRCNSKLYIIHP